MTSPSKPTISKSGTRKKIVPHAPSSSLSKTATPTTSKTAKNDDFYDTILIEEKFSSAASTTPRSSVPQSTNGTSSSPNSSSPLLSENPSTNTGLRNTAQPKLQESDNRGPPTSSPHAWTENSREDDDSEVEIDEDEEMDVLEGHSVAQRGISESGLAETIRHVNVFIDTTKDNTALKSPPLAFAIIPTSVNGRLQLSFVSECTRFGSSLVALTTVKKSPPSQKITSCPYGTSE